MNSERQARLVQKLRKRAYRRAYVGEHVRRGIAHQIRALREDPGRDWNQGELSKRLGKPQSVVSRMEDPSYGKLTVQTLLEVAAVFDVALSIRFVSFPAFVAQIRDLTEESMQVESFDQSEFAAAPEERLEVTPVGTSSVIATSISRGQSNFNKLREDALLREIQEPPRSTAWSSRVVGELLRKALSAAYPSSTPVGAKRPDERLDPLDALVTNGDWEHLRLPSRSSGRGLDWVRH